MDNLEELKSKYLPEEYGAPVIPGGKSEPEDTTSPADVPQTDEDAPSPAAPPDDASPASAAPPKKRRPLFWKIYIISVAVFGLIICGALFYFRVYLKEYEDTRPLHAALKVVEQLADGKDRHEFVPHEANEFDSAVSVAEVFAAAGGNEDVEVTEKIGVSTDSTPIFSVRRDGREICTVRLKKGKEHRFFSGWKADGVFFGGSYSIDITLTEDTQLLLNGVPVGNDYVVSRDEALPGYTDFGDITPNAVRYVVEGLLYEPKMTLLNDYCYPSAEFKNGVWVVSYPGASVNRRDAGVIAYNAARAYVTYASSKDSPLEPLDRWLIPDSTLRERVLSFNRRYFMRHDSAEFKNMEILDFSVYGPDQFSVKLSFDYVMTNGRSKKTEQTVMTLYMLRWKGEWKLSDVASE